MSAANKSVVRRAYAEVWNHGDLAAADDLFAADLVIHHALEREALHGVDSFRKFPIMLRAGFPDLRVVVETLTANGDRVGARWVIHGTHTGVFLGVPPTNTRVEIPINEILRVSDARIREMWLQLDVVGVARQLGMMPRRIPRPVLSAMAWRQRRRRRDAGR